MTVASASAVSTARLLVVEDDDSIWTQDGGSTGKESEKESEFDKIASISQIPVRAPKRKRKSKRYSDIEKKITAISTVTVALDKEKDGSGGITGKIETY